MTNDEERDFVLTMAPYADVLDEVKDIEMGMYKVAARAFQRDAYNEVAFVTFVSDYISEKAQLVYQNNHISDDPIWEGTKISQRKIVLHEFDLVHTRVLSWLGVPKWMIELYKEI